MPITYKAFDSESAFGYTQITTFYMDFGLAEPFGKSAILDTYKRGLEYAKTDHRAFTELVMVLNWKIWEHYESNEALAEIYSDLWTKADQYAMSHLKGEELSYFLRTTD